MLNDDGWDEEAVTYSFVEVPPHQVPEEYGPLLWIMKGYDFCTGEWITFGAVRTVVERIVTGVPIVIAVPDYCIQSIEYADE